MATFLFQKFAHPVTPGSKQACALLAPFDVITVQEDTWQWGDQELANPWFRLVRWGAITVAQAQSLVASMPVQTDKNGTPMTHWRIRAGYLDLSDVRLPPAVKTWWNDDTRATPMLVIPATFKAVGLSDLTKARPAVPDPSYAGTAAATTPTAITS